MRSIALDIETMSTEPDAALTAIGLVEFHHDEDNEDGTGPRIDREFYAPIHLTSAVQAGGRMDPATVMWWMGEDLVLARRKWLFNAVRIEIAMQAMLDWFATGGSGADILVYARGPQFDCVVVKTALARLGMKVPWEFRNERDTRTMTKMYPSIELPEAPATSMKHFALDDAMFEARTVWHLWRTLNRPKTLPSNGTQCPACGQPQFKTSSGLTCANGHGF